MCAWAMRVRTMVGTSASDTVMARMLSAGVRSVPAKKAQIAQAMGDAVSAERPAMTSVSV